MFFSWKNPLQKELSPNDLHQSREEFEQGHSDSGNFLGASLIDKKALFLTPLQSERTSLFQVVGDPETLALTVPHLISRPAVEHKQGVLLMDFRPEDGAIAEAEPVWQRLWALSFYLDRAKHFRLFELNQGDISDVLGAHLPAGFENDFPELREESGAEDISPHLREVAGAVACIAADLKSGEKHARGQDFLVRLFEEWQAQAPVKMFFHAQSLRGENWRRLFHALTEGSSLLWHSHTVVEPPPGSPRCGRVTVLFRQRNALPEETFESLRQRLRESRLGAKFANLLDAHLSPLKFNQALVMRSEKDGSALEPDLLQISDIDGLPWPPPYRPLRHRHPGT